MSNVKHRLLAELDAVSTRTGTGIGIRRADRMKDEPTYRLALEMREVIAEVVEVGVHTVIHNPLYARSAGTRDWYTALEFVALPQEVQLDILIRHCEEYLIGSTEALRDGVQRKRIEIESGTHQSLMVGAL